MTSAPKQLFFFGLGYTASHLVSRLRETGEWRFSATARNPEKASKLADDGIDPVYINGDNSGDGLKFAVAAADAILVSTPPDESGCPALRILEGPLAARPGVPWIGYLSSNGVYGDHKGRWVDESTPTSPTSDRGKRRAKAEQDWSDYAVITASKLTIFRLPGIYGPGRSALDTVRAGTAKRILKPGQIFSRMHVDDIAAILAASLTGETRHELYNLADNEPAPPQSVVEYACALLGETPPAIVPFEQANLSPMGMSFYQDNKRVSNTRMHADFPGLLRYPTYREGLKAIFDAGL